jgi:hypothetical protein
MGTAFPKGVLLLDCLIFYPFFSTMKGYHVSKGHSLSGDISKRLYI